MDYWRECIETAFSDAGIVATESQIEEVAGAVAASHENYGMAHGYDSIPSYASVQLAEAERELARERSRIVCGECKGTGRWIVRGPVHSGESDCLDCNGRGWKYPQGVG